MGLLNVWVLSIVGIVILGTLIDIMIEDGKITKYIKSIFGIISLAVIASPIPMLLSGELNFDDVFSSDSSIVVDDNYLNYLNELKLQSVKDDIIQIANEYELNIADLSIISENISYEIVIISVKVVLDENNAHINIIDSFSEALQEKLNLASDKVVIYGNQ